MSVPIRFAPLLIVLAAMIAMPAVAGIEAHNFTSPAREAIYKQLVEELRCMVCQNQNLADSNAELAGDMRQEVFEMVEDGKSADQIKDFMLARYGDFALYRPPVKKTTWALWFGPFVLVGIGLIVVIVLVRQRKRDPEQAANLSENDRKRAEALLNKAGNTAAEEANENSSK
ncbi:MAG: cytochrome c-type biogenesis protein CcmH [Gammaproteobacteria bacterium]|nr:cytochrome c-type biogenesis protein CcmH [Gammaproteobacteria bacterium]MCP5135633.1 cytochrome c-type biogenesis protein CcmH [Gammaproteobacteria bacterium]